MALKILAIFIVGMFAAIVNTIIFDKRIRLPKIREDEYGKYLDLGIVKEIVASVFVAFFVALPVIEYVPVLSLIVTCSLPAVAGSKYISSLLEKYIEKSKEELESELEKLEREEKRKKKEERV